MLRNAPEQMGILLSLVTELAASKKQDRTQGQLGLRIKQNVGPGHGTQSKDCTRYREV